MKRIVRGDRAEWEEEFLTVGELRDAILGLPADARVGISNGDFHVEASRARIPGVEFAIEID